MDLRIGTLEDLEVIKTYSYNFLSTISYPYDKDTIESLIKDIVLGDPLKHICILSDKGMIAGVANPFIFDRNINMATEVAWWIEPEARFNGLGQELLGAFEYWAKEKANCKLITMVSLTDELAKFYEKNGYKLFERAYMKEL